MMHDIRVSAVLVTDEGGAVLLVRKRGTTKFMFPGGKPEVGETPEACAIRECAEEIGLVVDPERLVPLGVRTTAAANEPGHTVTADVFAYIEPRREYAPAAEIEELRWLELGAELGPELAPLAVAVLAQIRAGREY